MAKKKRKPKTPDPASFAFGVLQHVIEATGDKPDEPKPAQDQQRPGRRRAGAQGRAEGGSGPREEAGQEEAAGGGTEGGAGAVEAT